MDKTEFFKLLDKYLNGEATPHEEEQLLNFYYSFQDTSDRSSPELDKKLGERMLARINAEMHVADTESPVIPMWRKITMAAVILVMISFSLFLYLDRNQQVAEALIPLKKDLEPGKDKATLTLANGTTISLDDAAYGDVAYEGNTTITKTADGQIKYVANNKARRPENTQTAAINTIYTPRGGKYRVVLPDGSRVWLNSESSLRYPTLFERSERKVTLTGEAYFEIATNKKVPFRVESNGQVVEVLGTHFNISSYENDAFVKTTLLEGSVRVIRNASGGKKTVRLLKPGQQSLVDPAHSGITVENANMERAMAWKNGYFQFQNTSIEEVMREVSRWYDVEVVFPEKVPHEEFTGFISRKVKLSVVLKILEQGGGVSFSVQGRKVKVKSSQNNTP